MILHNSYITRTKQGCSFDGYIVDAHVGHGVLGLIFSGTPRFNDGDVIQSSEIVEVGRIPSIGWYVETLNRSRYKIANTACSAAQSGVLEVDMEHKVFHIKSNMNYFRPLQWS